jgi:glycosyltransferase involved in cell wall biosynthesis
LRLHPSTLRWLGTARSLRALGGVPPRALLALIERKIDGSDPDGIRSNGNQRRAAQTAKRPCTVVLSWHPEDGFITAGGFRRSVAVVGRLAEWSRLVVVDAEPSIFRGTLDRDADLREYSLPALSRLAHRDLRRARALQWALAFVKLAWLGRAAVRHERAEVIYVPNSELLPCSLAGALLSRFTGARLVLSTSNVDGVFARRLVLALHDRADKITVLSFALRRALRSAGVSTPVEVTGIGSSMIVEHEPESAFEEGFDCLFIGRHTREKGVFDLLEIWERVVAERPQARLLTIGACPPQTRRELEERCQTAGLAGRITIGGVVPERRKLRELRGARVVIAPSRLEGWGFVPLEALAAGVPVVCWDLAAYRESVPQGDAVARVPIGDIDQFAERVLDYLDRDPSDAIAFKAHEVRPTPWSKVAAREWAVISGGKRAR